MSTNDQTNPTLPTSEAEVPQTPTQETTPAPITVDGPLVDVPAPAEEAPVVPTPAAEEPSESWTIYVKTLTGNTVTLSVEEQGECTVERLKVLLQEKAGCVYRFISLSITH